jgi:hypothetical protein
MPVCLLMGTRPTSRELGKRKAGQVVHLMGPAGHGPVMLHV